MNKFFSRILLWPLIISLIAGALTYFVSPKQIQYKAIDTYTVTPLQAAVPQGAYSDLQASNLFMDVVKSWLFNSKIATEISDRIKPAELNNFRTLSMQTFELSVVSDNSDSAQAGLVFVDEILKRELSSYNKIGKGIGFSVTDFGIQTLPVKSSALPDAALITVLVWLIGGFVTLLWHYKSKLID